MLGLHRNRIDFEIIETGNPKTLVFIDSSDYMEEPDRPILDIIPPDHNKYFRVNIVARQINTLNSSLIGFNRVFNQHDLLELPDGVWEFRYAICPYEKIFQVKRYMRVSQLNYKLANLHAKFELSDPYYKENVDIKRELVDVYILIEGAKALADINPDKAAAYYRQADKMISKRLEKLCKNC